MKKFKFLAFALAASALALTTSCNRDDDPVAPPPPPVPQDWEEAPVIAPPGPGFFTMAIAVAVPPGHEPCNGIMAVGSFNGWADAFANPSDYMFERVEGTQTWYKITLPWYDGLELKPVALDGDGNADWPFQWGRNDADAGILNVFFEPNRPEVGVLEDGFHGAGGYEQDFAAVDADNSVAFFVVKNWANNAAPCIPPVTYNVTFNMTGPALPDGAEVGIVSSFPGRAWDIAQSFVMTYTSGTWSVTINDVPVGLQYKYVWRLADGTLDWSWDREENRGNRLFTGGTTVTDEVLEWTGIPGEGPVDPIDPSEEWTVQIHGSTIGEGTGWESAVFAFSSSSGVDAETFAGTYVFTIPSVEMIGGDGRAFGIQIMQGGSQAFWISFGTQYAPALIITGDTGNFSGTANINVAETRTYAPVTITIVWDGEEIVSTTAHFPTP